MRLSVEVTIYDNSGGQLRLSEYTEVEEMTFTEAGQMLEGFDKMVEAIKTAKGKGDKNG